MAEKMTPHGSKYEAKIGKELAHQHEGGHSEMHRVKSAATNKTPGFVQPYGHVNVHDAYKSTNEHGMITSHDGHRGHAHHTMDANEHQGMSHHVDHDGKGGANQAMKPED